MIHVFNDPCVRGADSGPRTVGDFSSKTSGICRDNSIQITSSGTTITDTLNGDEIVTVECNADGTMDVFYTDNDGPTGVHESVLSVTDVLITCD